MNQRANVSTANAEPGSDRGAGGSAAEAADGAAATRNAYEEWCGKVRTVFPELDIVARTQTPIAGRLDVKQCGIVKMVRLASVGHVFDRTKAHIDRSPSEYPSFCWQRAQPLRISHPGGTDELRTGGFVLHHGNRPHQIHVDRPSDLLCVQMPERLLRERSEISLSRWMGSLIDFSPSVARIVRATMTGLTDDHQTPEDAAAVGDLFMEVVGRGMAEQERAERAVSPHMTRRARHLVAFVEAHFRDETLSPADAAAELGCSLRLVHATAAALGTTFGRMVLDARLRAAMAVLRNAEPERVGEVAFSVGFSDLSHFSRVFKARYGFSARTLLAKKAD